MMVKFRAAIQLLLPLLFIGSVTDASQQTAKQPRRHSMREINKVARPEGGRPVAIVGATLIDGRGGAPVNDSVVVVRDDRITAAGGRNSTTVPKDAEVIDAKGLAVLHGVTEPPS